MTSQVIPSEHANFELAENIAGDVGLRSCSSVSIKQRARHDSYPKRTLLDLLLERLWSPVSIIGHGGVVCDLVRAEFLSSPPQSHKGVVNFVTRTSLTNLFLVCE
jgi:hypothetical protein